MLTAMLLSGFPAYTQDAVSFSGIWKSDRVRSESAHQATPIGPITLVISQKATEISIQTKTDAKDRSSVANETLVFKLDGSEATTVSDSGVPVECKAHWEGTDLVTETARNLSGSTITTSWVLKMDPSGKELKVKKTLTVQHGYQSADARNVGSETDIFVKVTTGGNKVPGINRE
jgi:hypothetical protein